MNRARAVADWPERALRWLLWRLEERLAVFTVVLLIVIVAVAVFWWDSSEEVRNFGLLAGGVAAGALAIWRSRVAERQAATAEAARLDARFDMGLRMLQDERAQVQQDGTDLLERLADEYPEGYDAVVTALFDRRKRRDAGDGHHDDR